MELLFKDYDNATKRNKKLGVKRTVFTTILSKSSIRSSSFKFFTKSLVHITIY